MSVQVDARIREDMYGDASNWGVTCRGSIDGNNRYEMVIWGDGTAGIYKLENGKYSTLAEGVPGDIVRHEATNRIRGDCVGNTLALYVNGKKVLEADDADELGPGVVGLTVETGESSDTDVLFDNFLISKP